METNVVNSLATYLRSLGPRDVAVHLPAMPEQSVAIEACRIAKKRVVELDAHPRIVVTADGVVMHGMVRCLKEEVDAAVPQAQTVIVFRHLGEAPLAPTLDVYLDVRMVEGRDVWFDQVGASG